MVVGSRKLERQFAGSWKEVGRKLEGRCSVQRRPPGGGENYHTLIQTANGKETYVSEPVLMVMKLLAEASKAK